MTNSITTRAAAGSVSRRAAATTIAAALAIAGVAGLAYAPTVAAYPAAPAGDPAFPAGSGSGAPVTELTGTLPDGATWLIEKPANFNGTLVLYGHGMVAPGEDNPALDAPDDDHR